MKQRFKGEILTKKRCINSILRFYELASVSELREGMNWYNDANSYSKELAQRFNISVSQAVGIIAAFSPQTGWQENKRFAVSFLMNRKANIKSQIQTNKARKICLLNNDSDIYNSLSVSGKAFKTKAFFLNIVNPDIETEVTIDRHAIATMIQQPETVEPLSDKYGKLTKKQYDFFQLCYIEAAHKTNILPQQLQAIVWTVYRRLRELRQYNNDNAQWQPYSNENVF